MNKKYIVMIVLLFAAAVLLLTLSCSNDNSDSDSSSTFDINSKEKMRNFVIGISEYAKSINANFIVIPQNGIELITTDGNEDGELHTDYLNAIDGNGQEDLFYGYNNDDQATPANETSYLKTFLDISETAGNIILVTDYCSTDTKMDSSYSLNNSEDYISFAADQRDLNNIPAYPASINNETANTITSLSQVQNFLYLINPENYATKATFTADVTATNYDLLIMDLFSDDGTAFISSEITQLKDKANGGERLVIAYMSIGEAEDYRYYWESSWNTNKPDWMDRENPDWEGNYKVRYWMEEWQDIIYGNDSSYLKKILDAGFDGVYLDIIDAFEYY